jgi:hypothetical protein
MRRQAIDFAYLCNESWLLSLMSRPRVKSGTRFSSGDRSGSREGWTLLGERA